VEEAFYYPLKSAELTADPLLSEKIEQLPELLAEFGQHKVSFDQTEDRQLCRVCDYALLCGRDT